MPRSVPPVRPPAAARLFGGALLLLATTACYDGFDPLDPEVLAEIARTRGDAEGTALSGLYQGDPEKLECGCDELAEQSAVLSMCEAIDVATTFGSLGDLHIEVIQADGVVRLRPFTGFVELTGVDLAPTLYGPLMQSGRVSAAGVITSDALVVQGRLLSRVDGSLDADGLSVELHQRFDVSTQLVEQVDGPTRTNSYRCDERIGIDFHWVAPPSPPLPVE